MVPIFGKSEGVCLWKENRHVVWDVNFDMCLGHGDVN